MTARPTLRLAALLAALPALLSAAHPVAQATAPATATATATAPATAPRFDPLRFFAGRTAGEGSFKVILRSTRSISVRGNGHVEPDGTLVLDQQVAEQGKPERQRQWRIRAVSPGRYTGTLSDATGAVTGTAEGDTLRLAFPAKDGFQVEQVLTLSPDGRSADNLLVARRFGIAVARLRETIRRLD